MCVDFLQNGFWVGRRGPGLSWEKRMPSPHVGSGLCGGRVLGAVLWALCQKPAETGSEDRTGRARPLPVSSPSLLVLGQEQLPTPGAFPQLLLAARQPGTSSKQPRLSGTLAAGWSLLFTSKGLLELGGDT